MRDRAMQALHLLALEPVAETTGDHHSYGFRRERSTADAIVQVRIVLGRKVSPKWVLEGDIKGCFDNISHDWLIANVCMDKGILRNWLKAGFIEASFAGCGGGRKVNAPSAIRRSREKRGGIFTTSSNDLSEVRTSRPMPTHQPRKI